ncbi:MAG TPA: TMEM175 family protein, partial [Thermoplasmata archaeon]|nr:TMEM175 family protein [Thermoplasmata archaeon]
MEDDEPALSSADRLEAPWVFRGRDMGRILALSDGVFAFAMTLLVLGLVLPIGTSGGAVAAYFQTQPFKTALYTYVLTFFVIGMWWQGHHLVFGYIQRYDRELIRLNSVFLVL